MQFSPWMRIRHDIVEIYLPCALFNHCFYNYAQTVCLSIIVNIEPPEQNKLCEWLNLYLNNNQGCCKTIQRFATTLFFILIFNWLYAVSVIRSCAEILLQCTMYQVADQDFLPTCYL